MLWRLYTAVHKIHYLSKQILFTNTKLTEHCSGPEKLQARNWGTRLTAQNVPRVSLSSLNETILTSGDISKLSAPRGESCSIVHFTGLGGGIVRPRSSDISVTVCLSGRHKTEKHNTMIRVGIELRAWEPNAFICGAAGICYTCSFNSQPAYTLHRKVWTQCLLMTDKQNNRISIQQRRLFMSWAQMSAFTLTFPQPQVVSLALWSGGAKYVKFQKSSSRHPLTILTPAPRLRMRGAIRPLLLMKWRQCSHQLTCSFAERHRVWSTRFESSPR